MPLPLTVDVHDGRDPSARHSARAVVTEAARAAGVRPVSDQAWLALSASASQAPTSPTAEASDTAGGGPTDVPVVVLATAGGPAPAAGQPPHRATVGCAVLLPGPEAWAVELAVRPGQGGDEPDVEQRLVEEAVAAASARGAPAIRWWMSAPPPERRALAERLGFTAERDLFQLRVRLPLAPEVVAATPPVVVRPFEPGRDEAAWLAVNNRAFATHPEQGGWQPPDLLAREAEPWFDPAGFLLYEEGGHLAAFCWTKVHREAQPVLGEIYVIGVDPDHQGRGLGRSLTVAGLEHLSGRGITDGMLYVDGANEAARRLYASLGFTTHHVDIAYLHRPDEASLPPGGRGAAGRRP